MSSEAAVTAAAAAAAAGRLLRLVSGDPLGVQALELDLELVTDRTRWWVRCSACFNCFLTCRLMLSRRVFNRFDPWYFEGVSVSAGASFQHTVTQT